MRLCGSRCSCGRRCLRLQRHGAVDGVRGGVDERRGPLLPRRRRHGARGGRVRRFSVQGRLQGCTQLRRRDCTGCCCPGGCLRCRGCGWRCRRRGLGRMRGGSFRQRDPCRGGDRGQALLRLLQLRRGRLQILRQCVALLVEVVPLTLQRLHLGQVHVRGGASRPCRPRHGRRLGQPQPHLRIAPHPGALGQLLCEFFLLDSEVLDRTSQLGGFGAPVLRRRGHARPRGWRQPLGPWAWHTPCPAGT